MTITKTEHLSKRLSKRCHLNKSAQDGFLEKAYKTGLRLDDIKHKPTVYNYVKSVTRPNCYTIIYKQYILILSKKDNIGITILNIPKDYIKIIYKLYKEEKTNDSRTS